MIWGKQFLFATFCTFKCIVLFTASSLPQVCQQGQTRIAPRKKLYAQLPSLFAATMDVVCGGICLSEFRFEALLLAFPVVTRLDSQQGGGWGQGLACGSRKNLDLYVVGAVSSQVQSKAKRFTPPPASLLLLYSEYDSIYMRYI